MELGGSVVGLFRRWGEDGKKGWGGGGRMLGRGWGGRGEGEG